MSMRTIHVTWLSCLAVGAQLAGCATSRSIADTEGNASIPFVRHHGLRDWLADGEKGIWVQDVSGQWYYGKFVYPCFGLQYAVRLRYSTSPSGAFDKWSEVQARDTSRCSLVSLTRTSPPPVLLKPATPAAAPNGPATAAVAAKGVG